MSSYDQSQTERELRQSLSARARQIQPSSRLDAILREASEPEAAGGGNRWLVGLAVAAATAVVAGSVWAARPDNDGTLPGGDPSRSATGTSSPTASASTGPSPSASPSPTTTSSPSSATTPPSATRPTAIAIYRVGTNGGEQNRPGLVREFWTASLPVRATESERAEVAVTESLGRSELWRGVSVTGAEVSRGGITLELSGSGRTAPDADRAGLAVSSLVWTAQGAVGRGDLPVSFRAGGGALLGHLDADAEYTRAGTPPDALCDIWIDNPAPGASVKASEPVVVRGQAVAWEANVEWELRRGTTTVRDGFVTASIGAPARGTFSLDLGRLAPGTWTIRAFTTSAEDGAGVLAERLVTFTVK